MDTQIITPKRNKLKAFITACFLLEELSGKGQNRILPFLALMKQPEKFGKPFDFKRKLEEALGNILLLYNDMGLPKSKRISPLLQIVVEIHKEVINNPDISRHMISYFVAKHKISAPTLQRTFKKYAHITLHDFVTRECMKKADLLMKEKNLTIENISGQLGYADRSGFLKAYKKYSAELIQKSTK